MRSDSDINSDEDVQVLVEDGDDQPQVVRLADDVKQNEIEDDAEHVDVVIVDVGANIDGAEQRVDLMDVEAEDDGELGDNEEEDDDDDDVAMSGQNEIEDGGVAGAQHDAPVVVDAHAQRYEEFLMAVSDDGGGGNSIAAVAVSDDDGGLAHVAVSDDESDGPDPSWKFMIGRRYLHGQYFILKPCGFILWNDVLHRSEGVARVVEIWNDLYLGKTAEERPCYTWTDSGCKIWPYIINRPSLQAQWRHTWWLIDRFHGGNSHNMPGNRNGAQIQFCRKCCDVTKMKPEDKPPGITRANSEAQEQVMNIIGKFQWTFNMHPELQWFFLFWMCFDLNELKVQSMVRSGKRVRPGPTGYI